MVDCSCIQASEGVSVAKYMGFWLRFTGARSITAMTVEHTSDGRAPDMIGLRVLRCAHGLQIGERRNLAGWLVQAVHQEGLTTLIVEIDGRFPSPAPAGEKRTSYSFDEARDGSQLASA